MVMELTLFEAYCRFDQDRGKRRPKPLPPSLFGWVRGKLKAGSAFLRFQDALHLLHISQKEKNRREKCSVRLDPLLDFQNSDMSKSRRSPFPRPALHTRVCHKAVHQKTRLDLPPDILCINLQYRWAIANTESLADVSRYGQADLVTVVGYDAAAFLRVLAFGEDAALHYSSCTRNCTYLSCVCLDKAMVSPLLLAWKLSTASRRSLLHPSLAGNKQ